MPIYVYRFVDTGETVEIQQSFTDDPLTEVAHPVTGDVMAVKKVFTPVGVAFKGDGFYKTDSRSTPKPTSTPASSSTETPGTSGTSGTSGGSGDSTSKSPAAAPSPATAPAGSGAATTSTPSSSAD